MTEKERLEKAYQDYNEKLRASQYGVTGLLGYGTVPMHQLNFASNQMSEASTPFQGVAQPSALPQIADAPSGVSVVEADSFDLPENFETLSPMQQASFLQQQLGQVSVEPESSFVPSPMPRPDYQPQQGLFSRIGSGLLGAVKAAGSSLAEPLAQGGADIADVLRFYRRAQMSQPIASYDPSVFKGISPQAIAASLPQFRAEEEQRQMKLEQIKAISDYRKEASKREPDMAKLRDLAARAYPELVAKQMFKPEKDATKSSVQGAVLEKVAKNIKLSEGEQKIFDMMNKEDLLSYYMKRD